jgi:hypothetical protein
MSTTASSIVQDAFERKIGKTTDPELWNDSRFTQFERDVCVARVLTWVALYDYGQMVWNHSPGALHTMLNAAPALCADFFMGPKGRTPLSNRQSWKEVFDVAGEYAPDILQRTMAPSMYWNLSRIATGKADESHFDNGKVTPRDKAIYTAMCCLMAEGRLTQEVEAGRHLALYRALQENLPGLQAVVENTKLYDIQAKSVLSGFSGPIVEEVIAAAAKHKEVSEYPINLKIVNNLRQLQAASFDRRSDEDPLAFIQRTPWGQHIYAKGISPYASMYKIPAEDLAGEAVRAAVEGYNYYVPITMATYSVRDATKKEKVREDVSKLAPEAKQSTLLFEEAPEPVAAGLPQTKNYTWFVCPAPSGSIEAQLKFRLGEEVDKIKAGGMKNSLQDDPNVLLLRRDSLTLQKEYPNMDWETCVAWAQRDINAIRQTEGEQKIRDGVAAAIKALPQYKANQKGKDSVQTDIFDRAVEHYNATKQKTDPGVPDAARWELCLQEAGRQATSSMPDFSLNAKVTNYVRDGNPSIISLDAPTSFEGDRTGHELVAETYDANTDDLEPIGPDDAIARISTGCRYEFGFGEEPEEVSRTHVLSSISKEAHKLKDEKMVDFLQSITRDFKTYPTHNQVDSMLNILEEDYPSADQKSIAFLKRGTMAIRMALGPDPAMMLEGTVPHQISEAAGGGRTADQKFSRALAVAAKALVAKAAPEEVVRQMQQSI